VLSEEASKSKKFSGHQRTLDLDRFFIAALDRYKAATGYGDTYAIFNILNEYLYEHGFMDKEAYEYHKKKYGVTLVEEAKRMLQMEEEAQKKAELQQQKPLDVYKRPNYFQMTDDQLLDAYLFAQKTNDTSAVQLIQFAAMKRGYRFTSDGKIVSLKGEGV
jgi:hypothetical protein